MTRHQFSDALKSLGMNRTKFAAQTGMHKATVYHWGEPDKPFPQWAVMLLAAWQDNMRLSLNNSGHHNGEAS